MIGKTFIRRKAQGWIKMAGHNFNFTGGEHLTKISATWFVSYSYYLLIDKNHLNWKNNKTYISRISKYNATTEYHKHWLGQIKNMNDDKLIINEIGVSPSKTKEMANEILAAHEVTQR